MNRVQGKVVLLSGAGSDLIQACARALIKEGARVVLADPAEERAGRAAGAFDAKTALPLAVDPAKESDWQRAIEMTIGTFGRFDAFVSGPPPLVSRRLRDWSLTDWKAFEDAHILGPWLGMKYAMMELRKINGGAVVLISTTLARNARIDTAANSAAAGALKPMAQAAALECGVKADGTRINSILIDPTHPPAVEGVPGAVVYFVSNKSTYMTGTEIVIDGSPVAA